jgi:transposase
LILNLVLSGAQAHDSRYFEPVLQGIKVPQRRGGPRRRPRCIAADKAYDSDRIRRFLRRRHIRAVIPERKDRRRVHHHRFARELYRQRNLVERLVGWHKERRALGTRYEKLALNFLALNYLAVIEQYTRRLSSDRT